MDQKKMIVRKITVIRNKSRNWIVFLCEQFNENIGKFTK